jgi:outer membrane protein OmpA-like peptidoglycan-associated protein
VIVTLVLALLQGAQAPKVPFAPGLQVTYSTAVPGEPDWESAITFISGDSNEAMLRDRWLRPGRRATGTPKWRSYQRPLSRRERRLAKSFYDFSVDDDTTSHRGYTWFMVSSAVLQALKTTGRVDVTYLANRSWAPVSGTLERTGKSAEAYSVLLDGQRSTVPAIRARGQFPGLKGTVELDLLILDEPDSPWLLEATEGLANQSGPPAKRQIVRIATRTGAGVADQLAADCRANVYDILFATGSAELDAESSPALGKIAAALAANPAWHITIVGHTDSIGSAASNLDLARRRAERVRSTLATEFRVTPARLATEGRGEAQPIEDNGTVTGRARNRRVELIRDCRSGGQEAP